MLKKISYILLLCLTITLLGGCDGTPNDSETPKETVDYAATVKLDMASSTVKQEVTVKAYIDGDTTHFNVPTSVVSNGTLKARYLAVNTPESTGKIEEWGKKASKFTKEKLSNADSIIIESNDGNWNADSTGERYLVWVWYRTKGTEEYRNLNIEILQNGLAVASSSGSNIYGDVCMNAIAQATNQKINVYSKEQDPDFYYGDVVEVTLKELSTNTAAYDNIRVAFRGIISTNTGSNGVYVESYDEESGQNFGFAIYYGFNLGGNVKMLKPGNEVRIAGVVQYHETSGTWQVADLMYDPREPEDLKNLQVYEEGKEVPYTLTSAEQFVTGKVNVIVNEESKELKYAQAALGTSIKMENLKVKSIYTTDNGNKDSKGAMTITCEADGYTIDIRTIVLTDKDGKVITADKYEGQTIDVKGIIDVFNGEYQIKVFSADNITIK